ncbi:Bacterial type II and III secretion system protein [Roseimaritima multifibrata]|uniref:Bacterial type II and III secretion system protein n=1 Tax=Roseimaritima multifibrata TaxID=1930274 RepID=A0A517M8X5_9BACT|nr:Bacterial type II and III secretion system protein [Roseimaritima multifibrata]
MTGTTKHRIWLVAAACAAVLTYQAPQATAVEPPGSPLVMPPQTSESSLVRGQTMLGNAQVALQNRDLVSAVGSYRQVAALAAQEPGLKANAEKLRQVLLQAGIDANMLPAVGAPATTGQQQVASLIAQARMAYDKGDIATAMQKTNQAKQIQLTPAESSAMRSAIGKLTLDVEAAAKRRATGSAGDMNPYPVQQAGATAPIAGATGSAGDIQRADYSSSNSGPAAATPAQATEPSRLSPPPGTESVGAQLYQQGVDALSAGNREEARRLFVQAWQHEAQLDSAIRSQLQAKLQLMQQPIASANNSQEALSPLDQVDQETLANRQRLYRQVTSELGVAYKDRIEKPLDALDRINQLRKNVVDADVDASAKQTLLAMVDRAIREQQKYVEENRADIELDIRNEQVRTDLENERSERLEIDDLIAEKVQTFDQLMSEQRFAEAQVIAKQVKALSPDSTIGTQMFRVSQIQVRRRIAKEIQDNNEDAFITQLQDAQNLDMLAPDQSVGFMDADEWASLSEARLGLSNLNDKMSPAEQEIKRLLSTEVDVKFRNQPLGEVLKTLEMVTGIPMFVDEKALAVARVDSSTPVTLDLTRPISLKSALDLILGQFELTYTIGNEVLQITTNEVKRGKMIVKTYKVADLVTPIPNFTTSYEDGLAGALRAAYQMTTASTNVQVMPVSAMGMHANAGGPQPALANQNPNVLAQYGNGMSPMMPGSGSNPMRGASGAGSLADFGSIMQLIQTTIAPETWEDTMGGPSTMAPYYQNLSLVISTTSDVHDQILELLASLRRLQNLQVTIEVRFISLSDSFFEQIGVDFDFSIDDNTGGILPADDSGSSVSVGLAGPNGQFTSDFDIKFANQNFNVSPIFGGVDPGALSTFGFAILSDIEAFFFIQAAQGDNRTNVMQAPKVTLFDGQSASIQDVSQRPFVTSISPVVGDFAVAQQPIIVVLNEGTELNVQAVVSDDKRFVRLTLVPFFSQIGDVDTFTYTGSSTTRSSSTTTDPDTGEPVEEDEDERITQGSTVQLPTFAFTSVNTTVSVPDGGTILLGGIKRLREGRGERGLPIMSKLPYINRLFRNTAIGRDASSLMLMVTPRIIIQEEEEIAQTGFDPTR